MCQHCWHPFTGPIWMVIQPGYVLQECCHCKTTRTVHAAHTEDGWQK